jgi:hypothetical protein
MHHPPFARDGRRQGADELRAALPSGRAGRALFDQLDAVANHLGGVGGLDRGDIGAVDEGEAQVRAAVPDRKGRRLDQRGERLERRFVANELAAQRRQLVLRFACIEEPEERGAARPVRRGRPPLDPQRARRSRQAHRLREACARIRDFSRTCGERFRVLGSEGPARQQVRPALREGLETDHRRQPGGTAERAVPCDREGNGRTVLYEGRRAERARAQRPRFPRAPQAVEHGRHGEAEPRTAQQSRNRQPGSRELDHRRTKRGLARIDMGLL